MDNKKMKQESKPRDWAITGVVILAVVIITAAILGGGSDTGKKDTSTKKVATTSSKQTKKTDLATRVETDLKANFGVDSMVEAPGQFAYINGMTNQSNGWVDVNYQTDCEKETATFIAKQIMSLAGLENKDLKTVNVICTDKTSSYATRDGIFTD